MTAKQIYNWSIIIRFTVFWFIFGSVYSIVEYGLLGDTGIYPTTKNIYGGKSQFLYTILGATSLGFLIGVMEVFVFKKLFHNKSFSFKVFLKTTFYILLIAFFLLVIGAIFTSHRLGVSLFDQSVIQNQIRFVSNFAFLSIMIYIGFIFVINLFIFEMSKSLGLMVVYNFIAGKYHKPRVEERIFMFMDMKSSTTIAEQLGHIKYYELLNKYYSDMSDDIIDTYGEIYQYVGDEIIISWPLNKGLQNNNCIQCFEQIRNTIKIKEGEYQSKFGLIPQFKAALHYGKVTTGEIGELKKEIVFSGDVLNTTSRIQALCNEHEAQLLISQQLLQLMNLKQDYTIEKIGEMALRGKSEPVVVFKLESDN